ncbi:GAF domain-containing protein [Actinopolymorpha rutila]|uniref:GAF domain-containing protein n=1 Tax=Actinopolymorpha rutila TaxID=446787 RepID=A0A852ZP77_9ACTN|nr:GAF domain-containing protein [Actinopolymorpha rutila]NYH91279.1 GAF domain-containing protein [Actinopolymorpha rutila]
MRVGLSIRSVAGELERARTVEEVQRIVKRGVRRVLAADGSTFVLLDHEMCYYADEDAMSPLWKGQRFPVQDCVSGWAMMNHRTVVISDIRRDPRIPAEAYRPTFVRSLVMAPILSPAPLGALGAYWARTRHPWSFQVAALEEISKLAATALAQFPDGLPDPGFPLRDVQSWRVRPTSAR